MSTDDFTEYWVKTHGPIASKLPGLRRYVQNVISHPLGPRQDYDGVAEMWFDDIDSMTRAFVSTEGQITLDDLTKFTSQHTTIFANEQVVLTKSMDRHSLHDIFGGQKEH